MQAAGIIKEIFSFGEPKRITIYRPKSYSDIFRKYKIFIDGICVARIGAGETLILRKPENDCELHAEIDWARSNTVYIKNSDDYSYYEIKGKLRGWRVILAILYATIWSDSYLEILKPQKPPKINTPPHPEKNCKKTLKKLKKTLDFFSPLWYYIKVAPKDEQKLPS